jgi:hypothetical protein
MREWFWEIPKEKVTMGEPRPMTERRISFGKKVLRAGSTKKERPDTTPAS